MHIFLENLPQISKMRIVCISDTHNLHNQLEVPDGDILIHAGDISAIGEREDIINFNLWLGQLPHKYKIVIAGNHDFYFENEPIEAKELLSNAIYLNDSGVEIEGLKRATFRIWGSPISPEFHDWAFNRKRGQEIRNHWEKIPENTDILITHCPPFGILDKTNDGKNEGCKDLLEIVSQIKPRLHIFGHIHEAYGQTKNGETFFINASIVGLQGWIAKNKLIMQLRKMAIIVFRAIKVIRKKLFGTSKEQLHNKSMAHLHWKVVNKAIVVEI
jgi:Icc-related predicted phosphoesterase